MKTKNIFLEGENPGLINFNDDICVLGKKKTRDFIIWFVILKKKLKSKNIARIIYLFTMWINVFQDIKKIRRYKSKRYFLGRKDNCQLSQFWFTSKIIPVDFNRSRDWNLRPQARYHVWTIWPLQPSGHIIDFDGYFGSNL